MLPQTCKSSKHNASIQLRIWHPHPTRSISFVFVWLTEFIDCVSRHSRYCACQKPSGLTNMWHPGDCQNVDVARLQFYQQTASILAPSTLQAASMSVASMVVSDPNLLDSVTRVMCLATLF